jgi:heme/copper-type cytochrome/quinol oxidase subunit 2
VKSFRNIFKTALVAAVLVIPSPLFACAACYGKSDSPLAIGMNWGIFTLMGVIVTVLATIASFFIYIIRKESALANNAAAKIPTEVKV